VAASAAAPHRALESLERPTIAPEERSPAPPPARDVPLDLLRGLAIVVLVVNHLPFDSWLNYATEPFLSAAETLVVVSGVVAGMVFGRRWRTWGPGATTRALLARSAVLYRASVVVVALVGLLTFVPGLETDALTVAPRTSGPDLYGSEGALGTALAVVTLAAGPWQFNILGFFIAAIALTPPLLWLLARGWWPAVLAGSWALLFVGRATHAEVLPSQSEAPFPLLIWQVLFVHGLVLGWHRRRVAEWLTGTRRTLVVAAVLAVAAAAAYVRLHELGLQPLGWSGADWRAWDAEHFHKPTLDAARMISMLAFAGAAYLGLRRCAPLAERTAGRLLLPLGRSSFYVFITHVFLCLAAASLLALGGGPLGRTPATVAHVGCLALLWLMVTRRVLFRWIPR
jgi:hypothetical protein